MCVSGCRTPCGTSVMYRFYDIYMRYNKIQFRVISPITGLSLRSVCYGVSDERGSSAPGCHRRMGGSVSI